MAPFSVRKPAQAMITKARDVRTMPTKSFLAVAYSSPFEARGQVFVVAEAETLTGGAADALLKLLEEPPARSPRHFLLLAASRLDLLATLRSRSLTIYLGPTEALDDDWRSVCEAEMKTCVQRAEEKPEPPLRELFHDVYAEQPWHLREQEAECLGGPRVRSKGDEE